MDRTTALRALAILITVALHRPAFGQPPPRPPAPSQVQLEEGRRHFAQGVTLYEEGNFPAALVEFQAAHDTAPAPIILYNIGFTYKALYRYVEAIDALERYLEMAARDGQVIKADKRREVVKLIEGMKALLAPVIFALTPAHAKLTVDGRPVPLPANGELSLAAGNHVAVVTADNHEPHRRELTVVAGQPLLVTVELRAIPQTGKLHITSSQPATAIEIDGQPRGLAPLELELGPGGHQLLARRDGFEPYRTELMLVAGQVRNVDIELQRPPPPVAPERSAALYKRWWFWTAIGTAIAGGTVTAILLRPGVEAPLSGALGGATINVDDEKKGFTP